MQAAKDIIHGLVHLFYPRLCEGCAKPLLSAEDVLCLSCSQQLPLAGYHAIDSNETALRFAGRIPFQHATSLAYFTPDGLLQHLLHGLKYRDKKEIGIYLGQQLAHELMQTDWIKNIDTIIPVPLHHKKQAARGYNQSRLIADGLHQVLHIPLSTHVLIRNRHTETQTHKTREERVNNMQQAFIITSGKEIENKHVLLIDDVLTTGATLEACALALMSVPGIKISIATIGIAV